MKYVLLLLLSVSIAQAQNSDIVTNFYEGSTSSGWDFGYDDEEEQVEELELEREEVRNKSQNEFFEGDSIPVIDGQVSRTDLEDQIKKSLIQ